jgi:HK97 family phage major capsid protein/HK97 family phage prohead protease
MRLKQMATINGKGSTIDKIQDRTLMQINRAEPDGLQDGDFVQWDSSGGTAKGKIESIEREGSINVPGSEFTIEGTPEDPAALIRIYSEGENGWEATETLVGHKFSTLTKIAALRAMEVRKFQRAEMTAFAEMDDRTYEFPFSSETPVARYFGNEVLSHETKAADLSRLNDGAPLLFNHDVDRVIGVVETARIDEKLKRGYARVRFSNNSFAQEVLADVKDGILRNVSFGYSIDTMEERGSGNFVATAWSPYEVSLVAIGADPTIGIGRSLLLTNPAASAAPSPDPLPNMENTAPDLAVVRAEAAEAERSRIAGITALTDKHNMSDIGRQLIEGGRSLDEARGIVLDKLGAKPLETVAPVDVAAHERAAYSLTAGIRALMNNDWSSREAGLVRELSKEVEKSGVTKTTERSFFVPYSALNKRATYVTSGTTTGGNIVATDLMADDFIEFLRNQALMLQLGVRTMPGLVGNVAIPRRSGVASTYYLSTQTTAITQSESTFDQVTLTPKNLAALSKFSRQTLLQATPGIEQLVRDDLTAGLNLAIDLAILNGSGSSGQPTGILNTSGIGSVAMGTNGAAITLEKVVDLETAVFTVNGAVNPNTVAYLTNYKVNAALKKLRAGGSTSSDGPFLFNTDGAAIGRGPTPASLNGYPLASSNQVPSTLTKGSSSGVCSALLMGDFSQAIVGFFGNGLEITVGEDQDDFSKALTSVRGIVSFDVAVRDPKSFAAILDITT